MNMNIPETRIKLLFLSVSCLIIGLIPPKFDGMVGAGITLMGLALCLTKKN